MGDGGISSSLLKSATKSSPDMDGDLDRLTGEELVLLSSHSLSSEGAFVSTAFLFGDLEPEESSEIWPSSEAGLGGEPPALPPFLRLVPQVVLTLPRP